MKNLKTETLLMVLSSVFLIIFALSTFTQNMEVRAMDSDISDKEDVIDSEISDDEKIVDPLKTENPKSDAETEKKEEQVKEILTEKESSLIYVSQSINDFEHDIMKKVSMASRDDVVVIDKDNFYNYRKFIYLSPDRELIAVTVSSEEITETYIADLDGNIITSAYPGSFRSWSPDSKKVLLYLSGFEENARGRQIYYLNVDGKYYDSELPQEIISIDISPDDQLIVYTLTKTGTDESTIYIRNKSGKDTILLEGNKNIFAWARFSPKGEKIAFLKSNLAISEDESEVWVMNSDRSGVEKISEVNWNYPPVWSGDGTKILFTIGSNVWEYDVNQKVLNSLTHFDEGFVEQPSYSRDGKEIVFSREDNRDRQIWSVNKEGKVEQVTFDGTLKSYPLIP